MWHQCQILMSQINEARGLRPKSEQMTAISFGAANCLQAMGLLISQSLCIQKHSDWCFLLRKLVASLSYLRLLYIEAGKIKHSSWVSSYRRIAREIIGLQGRRGVETGGYFNMKWQNAGGNFVKHFQSVGG